MEHSPFNLILDRRILRVLQEDAGLSNLELADQVGLSPTPCARRVKRLMTEGVITHQVAMVDPKKLGLNLTAHISVTMDRHTSERFEAFESTIQSLSEVVDCCVVTGQSADYLLKAVVRDMAQYEQFLLGQLTRIPGVTGVHSSFELRRVITRTAVSTRRLTARCEFLVDKEARDFEHVSLTTRRPRFDQIFSRNHQRGRT